MLLSSIRIKNLYQFSMEVLNEWIYFLVKTLLWVRRKILDNFLHQHHTYLFDLPCKCEDSYGSVILMTLLYLHQLKRAIPQLKRQQLTKSLINSITWEILCFILVSILKFMLKGGDLTRKWIAILKCLK